MPERNWFIALIRVPIFTDACSALKPSSLSIFWYRIVDWMFCNMPVFNDSNAVLPARPNVAHNVMMLFTGPGNESNAWATPVAPLAMVLISGLTVRKADANVPPNVRDNWPTMLAKSENMGPASPTASNTWLNPSRTPELKSRIPPPDCCNTRLNPVMPSPTIWPASPNTARVVSFNEYAASPISLKALRILSCASCAPALQASKVSWNLMV